MLLLLKVAISLYVINMTLVLVKKVRKEKLYEKTKKAMKSMFKR